MAQTAVFVYAFPMSTYAYYNPNPYGRRVDDCSVRAVSAALGCNWDEAYNLTAQKGREMGDMPHSDSVWGAVLRDFGYRRRVIPNTCPDCYTALQFVKDHPHGVYVLAFGGHVATAVEGVLLDSWDSRNEIPTYYYHREGEE